ncbi:serine/threonine-protein kinase [Actinoplanes sp. NPDC051513]|uniref:serine/threonine-protein kinase n=1 Tax=Actinoplanes sp. NPDC051513 TaxID=3363908 RepID=UPI0037BD38F6
MPGESTEPLRPYDPRTLGTYEIVGRLGEGGMGTVYLARTAGGVLVAVKMVRADLAPDDEFRRRFRSEVASARLVPPFCTAEVLDADPDHDRPYLVVEYVDGPTLAHVVEERGPLTSANLHSVAIGVATALTAIHGAGVIHRDLKPRNVLLAPGSPKVIDFGIARAMEATGGNTAGGQMVGTVAYMAPERFGDGDEPLTPAADIFAWGGVVAYAGTGRTPFAADSPPATAARILTQPPDLSGLTGPLRDLVGRALEKEPANRPSARELLDLLISGPSRPAAAKAALAGQPDLRAAAAEAQAVTGVAAETDGSTPAGGVPASDAAAGSVPAGSVPASSVPAGSGPASSGPASSGPASSGPAGGGPAGDVPVSGMPTLVGYDENSIVTVPISEMPMPLPGPPPPEPGRRWFLPAAVAGLVLAVVAGALMVVFGGPPGKPADAVGPLPSFALSPQAGGETLLIDDELSHPRYWQPKSLAAEHADCTFENGALVASRAEKGLYRCDGPEDNVPADFRAEVSVRLLTKDSCAGVWFRFTPWKGYLIRVCAGKISVGTHKSPGGVATIRSFPLDQPLVVGGAPARIALRAVGNELQLERDGSAVGTVPLADPEIVGGRLMLGVYTDGGVPQTGPYEVAFSNVRIWG